MAQKYTLGDVVQQISATGDSDEEWYESDDDLVNDDQEGDVVGISFVSQSNPLETAQEADLEADDSIPTIPTESLANVPTLVPQSESSCTGTDEAVNEAVFPQTGDNQFTPTPILQATPGPLTSLDDTATPYEFFEVIWGEDTFCYLADQTNPHTAQKKRGNWIDTSEAEMKAYLGMILAMGIHKLPSLRDYWSTNALLGVPGITRGITRNRFMTILSNLHLNDNTKMPERDSPSFDKLYKVRQLLDRIRDNSQGTYYPHQQLAVDEAMILFKGCSTLKQYMPLKPTKRGYKCWCMCDSTNGYMYNLDVYTGKVSANSDEDGLGSRVVKAMTEPLLGRGNHIYMDNFFSRTSLAVYLKQKNTYTIGIVRTSSKGWPTELKNTQALNREIQCGEFKSATTSDGIQCIVWKDKKCVSFINTICNPEELAQVSRRNKDGTRAQVACPQSVKLYNAYMGGVDLFDSQRKSYSSSRKSKKWWLRLFYFLLEATVVNSYILYKETQGTPALTLKEFILELSDHLMSQHTSRKRYSKSIDPPVAGRLCESHYPDLVDESKQCRVCPQRKRTRFCCLDCFREYHTKLQFTRKSGNSSPVN